VRERMDITLEDCLQQRKPIRLQCESYEIGRLPPGIKLPQLPLLPQLPHLLLQVVEILLLSDNLLPHLGSRLLLEIEVLAQIQ
jgi:hypothetical protein